MSVHIRIDLMDDGLWYGTLYVDGEAAAGSGRVKTPGDVLPWLTPILREINPIAET